MGPFTVFAMVLYVLFCFLGIMANGFIVVVLGRELARYHRLSPCDLILISLSAARFCLLWLGITYNFYYFLHHIRYFKKPLHPYFGIYFDFLSTATFWFATWLSVLFCVKIANFTHPIFLWLKWRVKGLVPWFLLASLLISFIMTMIFFVKKNAFYQTILQGTFSGNITSYGFSRDLEIHYFMPLKLTFFSVPCSIFGVSIVLLITSLQRHSWRMQHTSHRAQDASTQAHTRALKSLVSFLLLYALSFTSVIVDASFSDFGSTWFWLWEIVVYLSTYVHPFVLILGNSELAGSLMKLLLLPKTFWNNKRTSSPL